MIRLVVLLISSLALASGQLNPSWTRPFRAHKIAGNIYYVGTEDLACFLIATPEGHILINTGLAGSTALIRQSIESLGFHLEDIRILLTMQAHFDHVAAMSEIQRFSHAKIFATEADAVTLEDGAASDSSMGPARRFERVKVDRRLKDGDLINLGGTQLKVILMKGHTKGSCGYSTTVLDAGNQREFLFANMNTVVMPLVGNEYYPTIVEDFEAAFATQKKLSPDIWVAAHASQYGMAAKLKARSFVDPSGYKEAVNHYEQLFRETLAEQRRLTHQ